VLEAAAHHRELTLLGLPGSGKSTFGAHLLLALAQTWQGHPDALAEQESGWSHSGLLPIRVVLRRFADQLPAGDAPARAGDVWEFIARDLKAAGYGLSERVSEYVQRLARRHGAYFLLDGLDECGDAQRRGRVMAAVDELMRNAGSACRFVLTARPYAWAAGPDAERGVYALADFDDDQVQQFITAWYAALVKRGWSNPGEAERKRDDLLNAWQRPDLVPLARNPLLLTLMATLHTNKGRLPDDRADLYEDSVELLMLRWNRQIGADRALLDELAMPGLKLADLRSVLAKLAFEVHEQNAGREGAADIGEGRLERAFRPLLNEDRNKAAKVAEYIEKRAGLLIGQGEKDGERQFAFPHRTFQEFLAACYLKTLTDFAAQCHRLARTAPDHWRVVLPLAARLAEAERGAGAADALIESTAVADFARTRRPDPADWTCALLAGSQLVEIGLSAVRSNGQRRAIAARVAGWLAAALPVHPDQGGLPVKRRAEAGDVLAALGDPRFHGPERYCLPTDENLGFVRIPADPDFSIGTRDEDNPVWRKASGPIPMMTR
ncbi:NACHT domain-containing protein, partial [Methylomagnum sp.]